jgi:hypothetical protein
VVKSLAPKLAAFSVHVSVLKQAPPPARKIIRFVDAAFGFTAMPVPEPSRQWADAMLANVHV